MRCKSIYGQSNYMLIRRKTKTRMTKIAVQCTRHCAALVLGNFSLLFPSFLSRCNVNPSLLLGLCLCLYNPFSLLIVVYYFLLPGFICICCLLCLSHTFLVVVPNSWLLIVQLLDLCLLSVMDLGSVVLVVVTSSFQHLFAFVLPISSISSHVHVC